MSDRKFTTPNEVLDFVKQVLDDVTTSLDERRDRFRMYRFPGFVILRGRGRKRDGKSSKV